MPLLVAWLLGVAVVRGGVFINYRGEDSHSYGALLHLGLSDEFGPGVVFLDSESIPAGADYVDQLLVRVRGARVVLAVIGHRWLDAAGPDGRRLIDDPADWVRRELVEAFAAEVPVIPVLTDDTQMPTEDALPDDLAALARRQYRRLRHRDAKADLARLVEDLAGLDPELALHCPYPGPVAFETKQARFFKGRDKLLSTVRDRLAAQLRRGGGPLILIGPSGVGKSSLLRAGLLPALTAGDLEGSAAWPQLYLRPGADPVAVLAAQVAQLGVDEEGDLRAAIRDAPEALRRALCRALGAGGPATGVPAGGPDRGRVVIVVDQLEELFTQGSTETDQLAMLRALICASLSTSAEPAPAVVVLGLRADFYDRSARISDLVPHLQDGQILVPAMTAAEQRQAITFPAKQVGLQIDAGLADLLVTEAGGEALPQLAHVLRLEAYVKLSLKKYRPIAARNDETNVFRGRR